MHPLSSKRKPKCASLEAPLSIAIQQTKVEATANLAQSAYPKTNLGHRLLPRIGGANLSSGARNEQYAD
jgi:hypothetical protein